MNDKLTLEELATYLPWDIKCIIGDSNKVENIEFLGNNSVCVGKNTKGVLSWYKLSSIKPIIRNLSDLTKEIEVNGEKFVPIEYFLGEDVDLILNAVQINDLSYLPYNIIQKLLSWQFDIFNLHERGLAIDINTLNK